MLSARRTSQLWKSSGREVLKLVRPIMKDPIFLGRKSEEAGTEDLPIAADLLDTLKAHASECVGMAANMIGQAKRIIVFDCDGSYMTMFNPEILRTGEPFQAEEGCLSLSGPGKPCGFAPLKSAIRMKKCRPGSRPSPAGRPRSSSMRSTTATEF